MSLKEKMSRCVSITDQIDVLAQELGSLTECVDSMADMIDGIHQALDKQLRINQTLLNERKCNTAQDITYPSEGL